MNLPHAEGTQKQAPDPQALRLAILPSGDLLLDDAPITQEALAARFMAVAGSDTEVHLRADKAVPYGEVAQVLGLLQKAQLHRVAFVAEPVAVQP
jgi:biopolymer transport protein TolR